MSELEHLTNIILTILSKDNQARNESESYLGELQMKNLDQYILVFIQLLSESPRKDVRTFCSLHLRRLLSNFAQDSGESDWHKLAGETQKIIKENLMQVLLKESESSCRKILCELVGELAATIKTMTGDTKKSCAPEGREWDEINNNIWNFLTSSEIALIGSGFKILGILLRYCHFEYVQHAEQLVPILKQAIEHNELRIKSVAIETLSEYVENADFKHCKPFIQLVPLLLDNIIIIIDKNEDLGVEAMAHLTDMIEIEAKIFKQHFVKVFETLKAISMNEDITTSAIRENALETIVILIEKFPKLSSKQQGIAKAIYEAVFSYMVTIIPDVDNEWLKPPEGFLQSNDSDNDSQELSVKYCTDLFNRIIATLGQEESLPALSAMLQDMVNTNNWRYKYSALMALSQVGEHINDVQEMDPLVAFNLNFLKDENPKVRYAALHCIGQLSDDRRYDFQQRFSTTIIPALIDSFNDKVPRVTAHGLAALTNFLEGASKKGVEGWIQNILEPCFGFIDTGISLVKENAISTIAALAEAARQDFVPYWEKTAEIIFTVLKNVDQREYKQVRGQAIECLTIMGEAVGKAEFQKAAPEVIAAMLAIQQNHIEESDPQKPYLLAGWQRLSSLLRQEFTPYLKEIVPSLFSLIEAIIKSYEKRQTASRDDDDAYDTKNALGENDEDGKMMHSANTSDSEEVSLAVKMLATFLAESSVGYLPYVEKTAEIFTYLLAHCKNDTVRLTAAKALPALMSVLGTTTSEDKERIIVMTGNMFLNLLWNIYSEEIEVGNLMTYLTSMKGIIQNSGRIMEPRQLTALNDNILSALKESDQRKTNNNKELEEAGEEADEDQILMVEEENEKEEELHCTIAELIGGILSTHQELELDFARLLMTSVLPQAINPNSSPKLQKFGLLLVIAMIQHLGRSLIPDEYPKLCEILMNFTVSKIPEVRDVSAEGIGILAEKTGESFQSIAVDAVNAIYGALAARPRKEEDQRTFWRARARVVIALGKILKYQSSYINTKESIQIWFKNLPIAYYIDEAKAQHEMLVDIISDIDPRLIFGDNGESLGAAVKIFAQLGNTKLIYDTWIPKMRKILESLEADENSKPLLAAAIENLDEELRGKLVKVMTK